MNVEIPSSTRLVNKDKGRKSGALHPTVKSLEPVGLIGAEVARLTLFEHHLLARQNALVVYDVPTCSLFIELLQELVEGSALCSFVIVLHKPSVRVSLEDDQLFILRT
jgi:hypothetical protein